MGVQIKYAGILFREKVFCKKMGTLLLLQFFVIYMFCKPLIVFSETAAYPVMPLIGPFLLANMRYLFLFVLGAAYHFSDVPFMQQEGMYQIVRLGRLRWCVGQILSIIFRAFFLIGSNVLLCCVVLMGHIEWSVEWGKLLHTVALTNVAQEYNFYFRIAYETLNQFTPLQLTGLTLLVGGMVLCFLALLMFAISVYIGRAVAILTVAIMDIMIYILSNAHVMIRQVISKLVPIAWMRVAELNVKAYNWFQLPPLPYILTFLGVGMVVLIATILWKTQRMELCWTKEEA